MGLLSSIAGIIATIVGGPVAGAIAGGFTSILEGNDPFQAFLGGVTSFGLTSFMGGDNWFSGLLGDSSSAAVGAAEGAAAGGAAGAVADDATKAAVSGWEGPAADSAAQVPTGAAQAVSGLPQTPGGYVDVDQFDTQGIVARGMSPADAASAGADTVSGMDIVRPSDYANVGGGEQQGGIINRGMEWIKGNQTAAMLGLAAVGGVGQAALQSDIAAKKIIADRELQEQKTRNAMQLEEWKRAFTQGGSYFDTGGVGFKPSGTTGLRRPDGTLVYARPGIIAGQMKG